MSNVVITWLKAELAKLEGSTVVQTVETDVENIAESTWTLIKTQGLQDIYTIAQDTVMGAIAGAPWTGTLAGIEAAAIAAGKTLEKSVIAAIGAQAQADLIAVGKLLPPAAPAVA